jgi:hypothetical protein
LSCLCLSVAPTPNALWRWGRRQSATTKAWGSIKSAEIFAEGTAYITTKWDVHHAGLGTGQIQAGRGGRLM